MPGLITKSPQEGSTTFELQRASNKKAVVVGLYGVPGSGKTFLLGKLKQELGEGHFAFYEGSQVIDTLCPGGLKEFHKLDEQERVPYRQRAINQIGEQCGNSGKVGVVAGHFMFWSGGEENGQSIFTPNDRDTYTHILYLDVPADDVAKYRENDTGRVRSSESVDHLHKWQQAEKTELRQLCYENLILFSLVTPRPTLLDTVSKLLRDFRDHTEELNMVRAQSVLDEIVSAGGEKLETMLVMDADKTLAADDTGALFFGKLAHFWGSGDEECPLKPIFSSKLSYSHTAFRQAALLYGETTSDQEFNTLCEDVASAVTIHPEFIALLQRATEQDHVGAVIVTCGLRRIWELVLEQQGLSKAVRVIGGGRIGDDPIITAAVKAALVTHLKEAHRMFVFAFGDSRLDLDMFSKADKAIVIVGEEQRRSKSMDLALTDAIDNHGLRARQVVLPSSAPPRLDNTRLPQVQLTEPEFVDSVLCRRIRLPGLQFVHATDKTATKLLMTPMRDAAVSGPALREAHRRVGRYLATEYVADAIGVEKYPIKHVLGHQISGYRLRHEQKTSIVALMRGGEPMALGVSDAFPLAMLIHANRPEDIKLHHLQGQITVVLVDSVVNSGTTVIEFVQHVSRLHATIRIVIVTGVAQAESVSPDGGLALALAGPTKPSVFALRVSKTKFTGSGGTDTGNRLFNTTHLP